MQLVLNPYGSYLSQLPSSAHRTCLALVCSEDGFSLGMPERLMEVLENLELVRRHLLGWKPTWLGYAVNNWRRQVEASLFRDPCLPIPEPVEHENGRDPGLECCHYRELYFSPGICWCLRPAREHPNYLSQLAESFLRWHNENERRSRLHRVGSGRPLPELLSLLTTLDRAILEQASAAPANSIQLGELAVRTACLVDFFSLKTCIDRLQALELLDSCPFITLTWDGRGVHRWTTELDLSRRKKSPLSAPRPGENGVDALAVACEQFRGLLGEPEKCWCGWARSQH